MSDTPLTESEQRLVEQHFAVAKKCARAFAKTCRGADRDELESEAMLALCRAAQSYDESRGDFSGFAWACMTNAMKMLLRAARAISNGGAGHISIDDSRAVRALQEIGELQSEAHWEIPLKGEMDRMREAVATLTPTQTRVLAGASLGLSDQEMAEATGRKRESVRQDRNRGVKKLKSALVSQVVVPGAYIPVREHGHLAGAE